MNPVQRRIEEIELRSVENQLAPALKTFLHQVWDQRNEPDFDIYKIYVGGRPHAVVEGDTEPWDEGLVQTFLDQLKQILVPAPMIQAYGSSLNAVLAHRHWFDLTGAITAHPSIGELQKLARITKHNWMIRDLGKSFFHFRTGASPAKRLYLNVLPAYRGRVIQHIVNNVVNQNPNVTNAKVSGPLSKGLDTIVIYARNDTAIGTALSVLAEYQRGGARTYFSPQAIQLARQVKSFGDDTLIGVAADDEPGERAERLGGEGWRPSFGDYWETFLQWVMTEAPVPMTKLAFFKKVQLAMLDVGLDALRPEL